MKCLGRPATSLDSADDDEDAFSTLKTVELGGAPEDVRRMSPSTASQHTQRRTHFKTPEGRYRLGKEWCQPGGAVQYNHQSATKVTLAWLADKPGVHPRAFLLFNVADTVFIYDYENPSKEPFKTITFPGSFVTSHAHTRQVSDGCDLLVGLSTGEVWCLNLRQNLHDAGRKPSAGFCYNKDGAFTTAKCTAVRWQPNAESGFISLHADGSLYKYERGRDGSVDPSFPPLKDSWALSITPAKNPQRANPTARWHLSSKALTDSAYKIGRAHV